MKACFIMISFTAGYCMQSNPYFVSINSLPDNYSVHETDICLFLPLCDFLKIMEAIIEGFVTEDRARFPNGPPKKFSYGTAGFRERANLLECVLFRASVIAGLRSRAARGSIGIVITASHNPVEDNGVKFVDTRGEMLIPEWESVASEIANATNSDLKEVIMSTVNKYSLNDINYNPVIQIARDTRPSSDGLLALLKDGLQLLGVRYTDHGLLTTPQLHFIVKSHNSQCSYGQPTPLGYYQKLSKAFRSLMSQVVSDSKPVMKLDAANGVGAGRVIELLEHIGDIMNIEVYNDGTNGELNYMCGADFVKASQVAPNGVPIVPGGCYVSFDGDADRIVFWYCSKDGGKFVLLDGDRIASLMAMFIKDHLLTLSLKLNMSVIQTAYANGSSTTYIQETLDIPVTFTETGVKYLQRKAQEFDIGIFFEANGHGTVLYSDTAVERIKAFVHNEKLSDDVRSSGKALLDLIDLTNQTTGDSISDMLIVQVILSHKKWSFDDWANLYTDLPNEQIKVKVKDRQVIKTADEERKCVKPDGLQDLIDKLVNTVSKGRSFVRPSGTEDIVRVYAEAETKEEAHSLGIAVAQSVFELAGGIGTKPVL
ncbi:PREDICTED: phosphoacetylglucosamine mutase-like [Amphimedon queenslandica]|uniref:Phosphoacetylglucosamine mutase n=1 Tax=Amphimedon queenslandica TaxID=400682 RepID=A0A1X7VL00_AMPQE|nr:PREDICTED: phosphoacetylglucosamine mutase-like [Amphimedon queenslandica]|eukprot:XP_019864406.1 PREDICTED: phosphoacetylglucosamine mutase-like [Amphimedon queenslandica]